MKRNEDSSEEKNDSSEKNSFRETEHYCENWLKAFYLLLSDDLVDIRRGIEFAEKCVHLSAHEEPYIESTIMIRQCHLFRYENYEEEKRRASTCEKLENTDDSGKVNSPFSIARMLSYSYGMSIVRMVNAVTDRDFRNYTLEEQQKTRSIHNSVKERAEQRYLPQELVQARHASTHAMMPSLEQLEFCACLALSYLSHYYWVPMSSKILRNLGKTTPEKDEVPPPAKKSRFALNPEPCKIDEIPGISLAIKLVKLTYPDISSNQLVKSRNIAKLSLDQHRERKNKDFPADPLIQCHKEKEIELSCSGVTVPLPPGFKPAKKSG